MFTHIKQWARRMKAEVMALYWAYRDPRVPWYAKGFAAVVVAYALSPIDLIPDFIPVLGYVDDVILIPIGIYVAIRLIPPDVLAECREKAASVREKPVSRVGLVLVIMLWITLAVGALIVLRQVLA